ncbi:MAG: hypothetical protein R3C11_01380 [Planctomycetaceae bacterium]
MRKPVDYRKTLFRSHLEREFLSIDEILPLKHLDDKWHSEAARLGKVEELKNLLRPEEFLYRDLPADDDSRQVLFLALKLFEVNHTRPPIRDRENAMRLYNQSNTFTTIIQKLDAARDKEEGHCGIVLRARSGGGKTLSCRRAMYDCFPIRGTVAGAGDHRPAALGGYLPCFARTTEPLALGEAKSRGAKELDRQYLDLIIDLLARQSDLPKGSDRFELLERILPESCPPLLIFFDLNTAGRQERLILARGIKLFQKTYGKHGHRCIVTYRTNEVNDAVMDEFNDSTLFRHFDMTTITLHEATIYLREYRKFEKWVCEQLGMPLDERDIDQEVNLLKQFLSLYAGGAESLVSTPLLMHWVASLDSLEGVESITDLYDRVIAQQIRYEHNNQTAHVPARLRGEDGKRRIINAATRIALYMQSQNTTRLSRYQFEKCVKSPWNLGTKWWPAPPASKNDLDWRNSSYYLGDNDYGNKAKASQWTIKEDEDEIKGLTNFSLFRREQSETGQSEIGFLHDSMIPYFTGGVALVQHEEPESEICEESKWLDAVTKRLRDDAVTWELPAEFLGGAVHRLTRPGEDDPLVRALTRRLILEARENDPAWVKLLQRYSRGASSDPVLHEVEFALRRNPGVLFEHSEQIISEVVNFVEHIRSSDTRLPLFAKAIINEWKQSTAMPTEWLHIAVTPPLDYTINIDAHSRAITSLEVFNGDSIVSGGEDGKVKLIDPNTGSISTLIDSTDKITCLAVNSAGLVISGDYGGKVTLYDPRRKVAEIVTEHDGFITNVISLSNDCFAYGTSDGSVMLLTPHDKITKRILKHENKVSCIVQLRDGRIASSSWDGTIKAVDAFSACPETIFDHGDIAWVRCLEAMPDGRLASGDTSSCTVRIHDLEANTNSIIWDDDSATLCLTTSPKGLLAGGMVNGRIRVYDPKVQVVKVFRTPIEVDYLASLPEERFIYGTRWGRVGIVDYRNDSHIELPGWNQYPGPSCVASLSDGRIVCSGTHGEFGNHGELRIVSTRRMQPWRSLKEQKTHFVKCFSDGELTCVGELENGQMWYSTFHPREIGPPCRRKAPSSLSVIQECSDGRSIIVVENRVYAFDPNMGKVEQISEIENNLKCIAVFPNNDIVTAESDSPRCIKLYSQLEVRRDEILTADESVDDFIVLLGELPHSRVAIASRKGHVIVYCLCARQIENSFETAGTINCMAVLSEDLLAVGCNDGSVSLINLSLNQVDDVFHISHPVRSVAGGNNEVYAISKRYLALCRGPSSICLIPPYHIYRMDIDRMTGQIICGTTAGLLYVDHVTKGNLPPSPSNHS